MLATSPEEQRSHLKRLWNGRQCSSSTRSTLHVVIAGSDTVEGCLIVGLLKVIGPPSLVHFVCEAFYDAAPVFDLGACIFQRWSWSPSFKKGWAGNKQMNGSSPRETLHASIEKGGTESRTFCKKWFWCVATGFLPSRNQKPFRLPACLTTACCCLVLFLCHSSFFMTGSNKRKLALRIASITVWSLPRRRFATSCSTMEPFFS